MQPQAPQNLPDGYDFLQNAPAQKKPLMTLDGSLKQRIILVSIAVIVIIGVVMLAINLLGRGGRAKSQLLLTVLQEQNEIIRVAELGNKSAKGRVAQNYSATVKVTLTTDQVELLSLAGKNGLPGAAKLVGGKKDTKTDKLLEEATQTNKFDEVIVVQLQKQILQYGKDVKKAKSEVPGKKAQAVLKRSLENAIKLLPKAPEQNPDPGIPDDPGTGNGEIPTQPTVKQ